MKKTGLGITALLACLLLSAAGAAPGACAAGGATAEKIGRLKVYKTAEWDGEWRSLASQIDAMEKHGIFRKAAALSGSYSADEIKRHLQAVSREGIMRVRVEKGTFSFMTADGTAISGKALYSYEGFRETMMDGREVQWHRFRLADGYDRYPELICSEPNGFLGQWILLGGGGGYDSIERGNAVSHLLSTMFPADISPAMIADIADTQEFIQGLVSLLPKKR